MATSAERSSREVASDDVPQDGDSPTGGYATDEDGIEELPKGPIYTTMSASDEFRMAVINEVRRHFHRTVTPLTASPSAAAPPAPATEDKWTISALLMTRMMRIIGQKAADLVELQALPGDSLSSSEGLKYFCQPSSAKLRELMANETSRAADLFFRLNVIAARKELRQAVAPQFLGLGNVQLPFLLPAKTGLPRPVLVKPDVLLDAIAPELTVDEQAYAYALEQLATTVYGIELADFLMGRTASHPATFLQQVLAATSAAVASGTTEISNILKPEFMNSLRKRVKETEVGELALALRALDDSERQTLQAWVAEVLDKGWQILLRRVSHLATD